MALLCNIIKFAVAVVFSVSEMEWIYCSSEYYIINFKSVIQTFVIVLRKSQRCLLKMQRLMVM
jgi:hypothetical protein